VALKANKLKHMLVRFTYCFYYMGSSIVGSAGGWFWLHGGWSAIVGLTVVLSLIGIFLAVYTSHAKAH
jgi:YNFM family putative membrane transporter